MYLLYEVKDGNIPCRSMEFGRLFLPHLEEQYENQVRVLQVGGIFDHVIQSPGFLNKA